MQTRDSARDPLALALMALAGIAIVLGVFSRFATTAEIGMWYDELHSVVRLSNATLPLGQFIEHISHDTSPPLYYLLLYGVKKAGIHSETQIRMVQTALFFITILLLWSRLNPVRDGLIRTIQSAFLISSYGLIYYSAELRAYSLMILLGIVQSLLFLRIVFALEAGQDIPHRRMIAFAMLSAALTIAHYLGAVAVGASFALLAGFLAGTGLIRGALAVMAYGLVACLPVIGWFLASQSLGASHHPAGLLADPVFLVRQIDRFLRLLGGNIAAAFFLSALIAAALWTVVRELLKGAQAPVELRAAQWLGALAATTWIAAYAITILILPLVSMRNMLVTAPAIYLALACVIDFWLRSRAGMARAGIVMALLYLLSSAGSALFEHDPLKLNTKKDWVASAGRINELEECAAQPIIVVAHPVGLYRYYIDGSKHIELVPLGTPSWSARLGDGELQQWVHLLDREVAQARELLRSSRCGVKMWYVPTGFVSEEQALDLGVQVLEARGFKLERVGNAFLFRG